MHFKPGYVLEKINFTDTGSDPSDKYDTSNLSKHPNLEDDTVSFYKTAVEFLQKLHFYINLLKFVLGWIPSVDDKISAMKNKVDETPYNPRWEVLQVFHLKHY